MTCSIQMAGEGSKQLLKAAFAKKKMSSGSYGWSSAGKLIQVEVEVDGKKQLIQAQVSTPDRCQITGSTCYSGQPEHYAGRLETGRTVGRRVGKGG